MSPLPIAIIGGTGPQGSGLGYRFARAGHPVILGSRTADRAARVATDLSTRLPAGAAAITGAANVDAADAGAIVVLCVPFDGQAALIAALRPALAGKVVVSCVNPIGFDRAGPYGLPVAEGSAAEQAAALLPDSTVVGAFHHLSATNLLGDADLLDHEDVLVCGDDPAAKATVGALAATITGRPGVDAGALRLARHLEPLTATLISINKRYRIRSGIMISGLPAGA
jgi:NADPH-dependent F420 reductase